MNHLQHKLQTALYFSAPDLSCWRYTYKHDVPISCLNNCPS